jgi:hypothetical protein
MEQYRQSCLLSDEGKPASPLAEPVPALKLQTTGPGNLAYLEQDSSGRVFLHFRGLRFDVDDLVPASLAGKRRQPASTAGEFVCRQMLMHHGYREEAWPALAYRFLLQHAARRDAAPSRRRI